MRIPFLSYIGNWLDPSPDVLCDFQGLEDLPPVRPTPTLDAAVVIRTYHPQPTHACTYTQRARVYVFFFSRGCCTFYVNHLAIPAIYAHSFRLLENRGVGFPCVTVGEYSGLIYVDEECNILRISKSWNSIRNHNLACSQKQVSVSIKLLINFHKIEDGSTCGVNDSL